MSAILPDLVDEGQRLLALAHDQNATFALLGGVAVRLHAPEVPTALDREYKDLDFAVPKGGTGGAGRLLTDAGYEPQVVFNAMNGKERCCSTTSRTVARSTCSWGRSACATRSRSPSG